MPRTHWQAAQNFLRTLPAVRMRGVCGRQHNAAAISHNDGGGSESCGEKCGFGAAETFVIKTFAKSPAGHSGKRLLQPDPIVPKSPDAPAGSPEETVQKSKPPANMEKIGGGGGNRRSRANRNGKRCRQPPNCAEFIRRSAPDCGFFPLRSVCRRSKTYLTN